MNRRDIASASTKLASAKPQTQELVGTGGTKLIPFLRTSRDETSEAAVSRKLSSVDADVDAWLERVNPPHDAESAAAMAATC